MADAQALLKPYRLGRKAVYRAVEGLTQEDALWRPAPGVKSIQGLLVHLGGAERFWLDLLAREVLDLPQGDGLEEALDFLRGMEALMVHHVESAGPDLVREVTTARGPLNLAWVLKRVTQHAFYHLGTLVYLRLARQPDWSAEAGLGDWQRAADAFSALVPVEP